MRRENGFLSKSSKNAWFCDCDEFARIRMRRLKRGAEFLSSLYGRLVRRDVDGARVVRSLAVDKRTRGAFARRLGKARRMITTTWMVHAQGMYARVHCNARAAQGWLATSPRRGAARVQHSSSPLSLVQQPSTPYVHAAESLAAGASGASGRREHGVSNVHADFPVRIGVGIAVVEEVSTCLSRYRRE